MINISSNILTQKRNKKTEVAYIDPL